MYILGVAHLGSKVDWPDSMKIPILSDMTKEISIAYNVLKEDEGIAFR